jgi:peptide-methionine (R)-S-oxide reductase
MKDEKDFEVDKTDTEWQETLTPEAFQVLRCHATEMRGTSPLNKEKRDGTYYCAGCGASLFEAGAKFESGTGWPSFDRPMPDAVGTRTDQSHFMSRTEVHCRKCGGHLGHVFDDGPTETGQRYCMNGVSLKFEPKKD